MKPWQYFVFALLLLHISSKALAQTVEPSVKIISVKAGNNQKDAPFICIDLSSKEPPHLLYDQNYVQFEFKHVTDTGKNVVSYRLIGLDYSWITCNNCSQVNYAHLDGGEYTFEVKSDLNNQTPAQFNFSVEGNIWHKWWFIPMLFAYFLLAFGIVIYFFKLYEFRQKHKEQWLIHNEKMASMVELTAGVAHEIQNPLNFVNNFSDVNKDLIDEMKNEMDKGNVEEARLIADDLRENELKITHHGKRAEAIVKSMLQHSKSHTGQRELIDINVLIDEYFKPAHHSFLAKDATFKVTLETSFATNLHKVKLIPQDIGKVMINLLDNAFYSVSEKKNKGIAGYEPIVSISTKKVSDKVEIMVRDNGTGIPAGIVNKIFQPFFTTKPTGQSTGLGLSLCYDIIKAHGGEIKLETKEHEFAEFTIQLPVK